MQIEILGITFFSDGEALVSKVLKGGLVQVPSGPGLADDLRTQPAYARAILEADYVIPDSGLMVLIWNRFLKPKSEPALERYSGLRLLRDLLPWPEVREAGATFWVMPTSADQKRNLEWLRSQGHGVTADACYLAPFYRDSLGPDGSVEDKELLALIEKRRPRYVFVNIGSGVQEQLGWYLRTNLSYKPAILCTGAAISFLTGGQADIPPWADRLYLGWLLRIINDPLRFARRYLSAVKLFPIMLRYRSKLPSDVAKKLKEIYGMVITR